MRRRPVWQFTKRKKIDDAWRDLLFAEFHDALPGSCIQPVEDDTLRMLNHGLEIMNQLKAKYFLALSAGQEKIKDGNTVPLLVYNPHPFEYTQPIDVEFLLPRQLWHKEFSNPVVYRDGVPVRSQQAKESGNFYMDWCKRVIFDSPLPPCSVTRFDIHFEVIEKRPEPVIRPERGKIRIETARGQVVVNCRTGHVDSYVVDAKEYLKPGAFAVNVHTDAFNCWEGKGALNVYEPTGQFHLMTAGQATDFAGVKAGIVQPVRVTDEGDVNVVVEADFMYNNSRLLTRYIVDKVTGVLEVELRVFNAENEKRFNLYNVFAPFSTLRFGAGNDIVMKHLREDPAAIAYALDVVAQDNAVLCELLLTEAKIDGVYYCVQGGEKNRFTPEEYTKFVTPSDLAVLERANKFSDCNVLHCCGWAGIPNHLEVWQNYPAKAINWACFVENVDLTEGKKFFGGKCVLGGFDNRGDSLIVNGTKEEIQAYAKELVAKSGTTGIMIGADCTLPGSIDVNRIQWVVDAVKEL